MVFGDVNLSENPIRERHGVQFNPGAGGWPTIRYFNADTGPGGAPYEKVTDKAMCEELKDEDNMFAYVEKAASTSLCSVETGEGCSDKEKAYIEKWKTGKTREDYASQMARIDKMLAGDQSKLGSDVLSWMKARRKLLDQMHWAAVTDEL